MTKQAAGTESMPSKQTDNQVASCSSQYNELLKKVVKLEKDNELLTQSLANTNSRLGVEIVSDSESSIESLQDSEDALDLPNTRHFQTDPQFANRYFFITNVIKRHIIIQFDFIN